MLRVAGEERELLSNAQRGAQHTTHTIQHAHDVHTHAFSMLRVRCRYNLRDCCGPAASPRSTMEINSTLCARTTAVRSLVRTAASRRHRAARYGCGGAVLMLAEVCGHAGLTWAAAGDERAARCVLSHFGAFLALRSQTCLRGCKCVVKVPPPTGFSLV